MEVAECQVELKEVKDKQEMFFVRYDLIIYRSFVTE